MVGYFCGSMRIYQVFMCVLGFFYCMFDDVIGSDKCVYNDVL